MRSWWTMCRPARPRSASRPGSCSPRIDQKYGEPRVSVIAMWARSSRGRIRIADVPPVADGGFRADDGALEREIIRLSELNRLQPSTEQERLLLRLRNLLAIRRLEHDPSEA